MKRILLLISITLNIYVAEAARSSWPEGRSFAKKAERSRFAMQGEEINDLFQREGWGFQEIMDGIDRIEQLDDIDSDQLLEISSSLLEKRDLMIADYLSEYVKICANLERIQRFLDIRFNMWVVQSKILPLLKKRGVNVHYNEETNQFEKLNSV